MAANEGVEDAGRPQDSTVRRVVAAHAATLDSAYPARGREICRWLRAPGRALRGIWFLSEPHVEGGWFRAWVAVPTSDERAALQASWHIRR